MNGNDQFQYEQPFHTQVSVSEDLLTLYDYAINSNEDQFLDLFCEPELPSLQMNLQGMDRSLDSIVIEEEIPSTSIQQYSVQIQSPKIQNNKRTSNTSLKPVFTCFKGVLRKTDDSFSGFFPRFMKENQNKVKKEDFEYALSFAEFHEISLRGSSITIEHLFDMYKGQFTKLIKKQRQLNKGQRAEQTQKFVDQLYKAIYCKNYKERLNIIFDGRKHSTQIESKRIEFREFKSKTKSK